MMLRQKDAAALSSSRREIPVTPPPEKHHAKAIGCMSGIFQLLSKYQNRNKLLTFGRKQEKSTAASSSSTKPDKAPAANKQVVSAVKGSSPSAKHHHHHKDKEGCSTRRLSCDIVPRSPTLPQEIRRSDALNSPSNRRPPSSTLVQKLMGLDNLEEKKPLIISDSDREEGLTEVKRKMLLNALEKCNEDLEVLKNIISAVQSAERRTELPPVAAAAVKPWPEGTCMTRCTDVINSTTAEQQLSPVCVLDEFTRSPVRNYSKVHSTNTGDDEQWRQTQRNKPREKHSNNNDANDPCFYNKKKIVSEQQQQQVVVQPQQEAAAVASRSSWGSKAMVQSIEEVSNDIEWGQKREAGKIGLVLQDHICRDLIEETVKELGPGCIYALPHQSCKRSLCF